MAKRAEVLRHLTDQPGRGRVVEMTLAITRVGLVGRRLQDQGTEWAGHAGCGRDAGGDLQDDIDGASQCLGRALDLDHRLAAQHLLDRGGRVVSHEDVDDIALLLVLLLDVLLDF